VAALKPIVIIPARLAASRLPNKPMALIHGRPMIEHVWGRAMAAEIGPVVVAAGDAEIVTAIKRAGGEAILTDPGLASGSDRVFAALQAFDPRGEFNAVINCQGDLPAMDPDLLAAALRPLADPDVAIGTLAAPLAANEETDPNVVKAVIALGENGGENACNGGENGGENANLGRALYFSRVCLPGGEGPRWHHIGIYAFRREALARFVALPPSALEKRERLEQLRALEAGMRIDVAIVDTVPLGVDTPADLERIRTLLAKLA
jgi:3-deoxy-manno-octulosonate cytidylyltransferase (CMP-KDO synthetase)